MSDKGFGPGRHDTIIYGKNHGSVYIHIVFILRCITWSGSTMRFKFQSGERERVLFLNTNPEYELIWLLYLYNVKANASTPHKSCFIPSAHVNSYTRRADEGCRWCTLYFVAFDVWVAHANTHTKSDATACYNSAMQSESFSISKAPVKNVSHSSTVAMMLLTLK